MDPDRRAKALTMWTATLCSCCYLCLEAFPAGAEHLLNEHVFFKTGCACEVAFPALGLGANESIASSSIPSAAPEVVAVSVLG